MSDWEDFEPVQPEPQRQYNGRSSDHRDRERDGPRRDNYRSRDNDRSDRRGGGGGFEQSRTYTNSNRNHDGGGGRSSGGGRGYDDKPSLEMEIEPNKVGMVIGRAGAKIREIQTKFNVNVNISKFDSYTYHTIDFGSIGVHSAAFCCLGERIYLLFRFWKFRRQRCQREWYVVSDTEGPAKRYRRSSSLHRRLNQKCLSNGRRSTKAK